MIKKRKKNIHLGLFFIVYHFSVKMTYIAVQQPTHFYIQRSSFVTMEPLLASLAQSQRSDSVGLTRALAVTSAGFSYAAVGAQEFQAKQSHKDSSKATFQRGSGADSVSWAGRLSSRRRCMLSLGS